MSKKLKNLLFILILGSVCTSLLLWIRGYTLPRIEQYQELRLKSSILEAAGIYSSEDEVDKAFQKNIREMEKGGQIFYLSPNNHYIFEFEGRGLWGMIEGVITLNRDLETIENIRIVSQEETPGLGGRISEEDFLSGFKRKKTLPRLLLALRRKAVKANEVDAITGATMTSKALIDMINESVIDFRNTVKR